MIEQIKNAKDMGRIIRSFRKNNKFTLKKISGLTNLSIRFISELERGKETAELGKALSLARQLGLEIAIFPRGTIIKGEPDE